MGDALTEGHINKLFDMIKSRRSFKYTFMDVVTYIFCHFGCTKSRLERKFEKGERRLTHELDITRFIHMMRKLKMLSRVIIPEVEQAMLKN